MDDEEEAREEIDRRDDARGGGGGGGTCVIVVAESVLIGCGLTFGCRRDLFEDLRGGIGGGRGATTPVCVMLRCIFVGSIVCGTGNSARVSGVVKSLLYLNLGPDGEKGGIYRSSRGIRLSSMVWGIVGELSGRAGAGARKRVLAGIRSGGVRSGNCL
jgi:hypothetical protein